MYNFKSDYVRLFPTLVISGQTDDIIVGSNVLKVLICLMKGSDNYCSLLVTPVDR